MYLYRAINKQQFKKDFNDVLKNDIFIKNEFGIYRCDMVIHDTDNNLYYTLSPLLQDIIYLYTYDEKDNDVINVIVEICIKRFLNNLELNNRFESKEKIIFDYMYNRVDKKYNNLINFIEKVYNADGEFNGDIVELYEQFKQTKRGILQNITGHRGYTPLIDDLLYVLDYERELNKCLVHKQKIDENNIQNIIYRTDKNKKLIKM